MILSKFNLHNITSNEIEVPSNEIFELPEKVLQFGTGVLLRALPDYFIDKANKKGIFNGRIVIVKSTNSGDTQDFDKQDGLYTICEKGIENGSVVEKNIINASVSRVLNARNEWNQVLECAHNPHMKIVLSNTTEVGITLVQDDIKQYPPVSFPGKLLSFLYERYRAFEGSEQSGMIIVPTELIPDNGKKLEGIVFELAHINGLEDDFISWLEKCNTFCNSLVDRIVPGKPSVAKMEEVTEHLGYKDGLYCESEIFRLWAIEGDEHVKQTLSFAQCDEGVVIQSDINLFRELKLRLLNATHTFNSGLAFLSGFNLTRDAMLDETYATFAKRLMQVEIASSIPMDIEDTIKLDFANKVFDRFCNPYIDHQWISITAQYSSKMKMRCLPLLKQSISLFKKVPNSMALGFAGYLFFMKAVKCENQKYFGEWNGKSYPITDDSAHLFFEYWTTLSLEDLVKTVLSNEQLWGENLTLLEGFESKVLLNLEQMIHQGVMATITHYSNAELSA